MHLKTLFAVAAVGLSLSATAQAALTISLNKTYTGTDPQGNTPWLVATFTDNVLAGPNNDYVTLTLSVLGDPLSASTTDGLQTVSGVSEFVTKWSFNLDPAKSISSLTATRISGATASVSKGSNNQDVLSSKGYDLLFDFPSAGSGGGSSRLGAAAASHKTSVYDLKIAGSDLSSTNFNFFNTPLDNVRGNFRSAAHVQGIGTLSAGIGDVPNPVPMPAAAPMGLALMGILAAVKYVRGRRTKNA
jgi:hypothetical protein